jgi:hypothetical protein
MIKVNCDITLVPTGINDIEDFFVFYSWIINEFRQPTKTTIINEPGQYHWPTENVKLEKNYSALSWCSDVIPKIRWKSSSQGWDQVRRLGVSTST